MMPGVVGTYLAKSILGASRDVELAHFALVAC